MDNSGRYCIKKIYFIEGGIGIMKKLKYIEFTGSAAIDTGIYTDVNTEVECWVIPVSVTATYWDCFFGAQKQDDGNDSFQLRRYDRQYTWVPLIQSSKPSGTGVGSIVNGDEYHIIMNKTGFTVNDINLWTPNPTTNYTSLYTLYFGGTHNNQGIFRPYNSKWIRFIVRNNGTVQGDFIPVLDDNDEPAFYDSVSGNYFYKTGTGTFTAGPLATTITTEPDNVSFDFTGGSESVIVSSTAGNWTADTQNIPSWLSVSPTTGTNGDTITFTASPIKISGQQTRNGILDISNTEDTAQVTYEQKGTGELVFPGKLKINDNNIIKEYFETHNIKKMYYNGAEIFRRVSFMPILSVDPAELKFGKTGGTATIGVTSNTAWSASTSASWLTLTTGATGITVTAPDYSSGETERNTAILVTASNGDFTVSETISVLQTLNDYTELAWISNANAGYSWSYVNCLTIPIILKANSSMRLLYEGKGNVTINDRLAGYTWQENDIYGRRISDNADWRGMGINLYDVGPSRTYINGNYGQYTDLTFGNFYVYDNNSQRNIASGLVQTITTEAYCRVDLDCIKVKGFYISEGSTEVFHGVPAMDRDGHVGLWDTITETLYYNPDQTMIYGEIE